MQTLTAIQKKVLKFIAGRREEGEIPPTLEEIRRHFGWRAIGTVQDHLRALTRKGYLKRRGGARSLEVLRTGEFPEEEEGLWFPSWEKRKGASVRSRLVPVVGEASAGRPILAVENVEESWFLDRKLLKGEGNFLVRVRGDSMKGAQIEDGDYVLVRPQPSAESGEIVVARLGEEVTVKRYFRKRQRLEFRSENPAYPPIVCRQDGDEAEIVGRVIGVLRKY